MVGNGCRPLISSPPAVGLEGVAKLALLLLRLRYSAIFSWKDGDGGAKSEDETFPRSSADLDHARRDIVRRSPSPEGDATVGLEGVLGG